MTIHQEHLHIIVHNLLANDGDSFQHPSRWFAYYIFETRARHNQLLIKAQCKELEVAMQFILHPVTFNSHKECFYA